MDLELYQSQLYSITFHELFPFLYSIPFFFFWKLVLYLDLEAIAKYRSATTYITYSSNIIFSYLHLQSAKSIYCTINLARLKTPVGTRPPVNIFIPKATCVLKCHFFFSVVVVVQLLAAVVVVVVALLLVPFAQLGGFPCCPPPCRPP